jgi:hypothetical protein
MCVANGTSLIMAYDGNSSGANASTNFSSTAQSFFIFSGCLQALGAEAAANKIREVGVGVGDGVVNPEEPKGGV